MSGMHYFFRDLKMLAEPGIRPFVILPVLVNLVLFGLLTWFLASQLSAAATWMETRLAEWLEWLVWIFWVIAALFWLVIYGFSFAMISNTLAAPFYGLLAEKVQAGLADGAPEEPLTLAALARLARRSLVREVQKLGYILPRLALLAVISLPLYFIPVINGVVPLLWFIWGAWSLSLQNLDYAADNNLVSFPGMRRQMARRRTLTLSFGAASMVAASIRLFNLFAMRAAVAGGTALWVEQLREGGSGK